MRQRVDRAAFIHHDFVSSLRRQKANRSAERAGGWQNACALSTNGHTLSKNIMKDLSFNAAVPQIFPSWNLSRAHPGPNGLLRCWLWVISIATVIISRLLLEVVRV